LTLEEAERALENQEAKIVFTQLELSNARQEIESRMHEKEEELENSRRGHQRALESMQASIDAEIKAKFELSKQKKKLEKDVHDLESALDGSNKNTTESQKSINKLRNSMAEQESQLEDQDRQKAELRETAVSADRRANNLMGEVDELRSALDQSDRNRKAAEADMTDAVDRMNEMSSVNAGNVAYKRKLESDINALRLELDDALVESRGSQESATKTYGEVIRQADELKFEQEQSLVNERLRKNLELQVKDLECRLEQAESNSARGGRKITSKLEQRIAELESELEHEQRNTQEALKESKRNDRKLKELSVVADDERHQQSRLQDQVEKLNSKVKFYRRQAEETEEVAASNLNRFRAASAMPSRR
jgi:chromosome segregation ATPase